LAEMLDQVEDWSAYHPPQILDNGDILIRRKSPKPAEAPQPQTDAPIDL